jgi:hypothetical protein
MPPERAAKHRGRNKKATTMIDFFFSLNPNIWNILSKETRDYTIIPDMGQLSQKYRKNPEKRKITSRPLGSSVMNVVGRRIHRHLHLAGGREGAPASRSCVDGMNL